MRRADLRGNYLAWVELFVLINLAFLSLDIYLAHSANSFRHKAEWAPFVFSLGAAVALGLAIACRELLGRPRLWLIAGYFVGVLSIALGLAGVLYHLNSRFFYEHTLTSLTYAAPFVAPLSYSGLGFLLLLNRMVPSESPEWSHWLLLLTVGGLFGNFILSVTDHAANGFFHWTEWMPVVSSALAVGFLLLPFVVSVTTSYLAVCAGVLLLQVPVGLLGFFFHARADFYGPSKSLFENVLNGAPPMAPLLLPNLVLLGLIALWTYGRSLPEPLSGSPVPGNVHNE